jgi:hypothetical protein
MHAQNFTEISKVVASDRTAGDAFGQAIAISGNYAIAGAFREGEDPLQYSGSAYILERNTTTGTWTQKQKIVASDRAAVDQFSGQAVAISGNYAVVGAQYESENENGGATLAYAGSAYIFERNTTTDEWTQKQKIVASDRAGSDFFGSSVSISGDYLIVGATGEDHGTSGTNYNGSGSVYIFKRDDGTGAWNQVQKIAASDRLEVHTKFGSSVAIDGNYLVVGTPDESQDGNNMNTQEHAGALYVFERNTATDVWAEVKKISHSNREPYDKLGTNVSISGNYIIAGIEIEDNDENNGVPLQNAGAAYLFERDASGNWSEIQKIVSSDRATGDRFGSSVSISGDYALVGAKEEDHDENGSNPENRAGSAYIFERDANDTWIQKQKIVPSHRDDSDYAGNAVAISGETIALGVQYSKTDANNLNSMSRAGAVYLFETTYDINYRNSTWTGGSGGSGEPTTADASKTVLISDGNPVLSADAEIDALTIKASASLTLDAATNTALKVNGRTSLYNTEALVVDASATGKAEFIDNGLISYYNGASIKNNLYLTGAAAYSAYHYISSPINNSSISFTADDLYGYDEVNLNWIHQSNFTQFDNAKGYAYRHDSNQTRSFTGGTNTGTIEVAVTATDHSGNAFEHLNLLGNPYPSSINATSFINGNSNLTPNVHFWNGSDYVSYNTNLGSGTGDSFNGNIAPGQGFFIETSIAQNVQFTNSMRNSLSDLYYKKAAFPQVKLSVSGLHSQASELLLAQKEDASIHVDNYDSKRIPGAVGLSLNTIMEDQLYAIQTVPQLNNNSYPLSLQSPEDGQIHFNLSLIENINEAVYLIDKWEGKKINLKEETYDTYISKGKEDNRFVLRIENEMNADKALDFFLVNGEIIATSPMQVEAVKVYNIEGKLLLHSTNNYIQSWEQLASGVYVIEVITPENSFRRKHTKLN